MPFTILLDPPCDSTLINVCFIIGYPALFEIVTKPSSLLVSVNLYVYLILMSLLFFIRIFLFFKSAISFFRLSASRSKILFFSSATLSKFNFLALSSANFFFFEFSLASLFFSTFSLAIFFFSAFFIVYV